MRLAWVVVVAAGCGRVAFDPRIDTNSGVGDDANDAPMVDALPASTCPQATLICEGFEAPLGATWLRFETGGTARQTTTSPLRGTTSLEAHTDAAASGAMPKAEIRTNQNIMGTITGTLYARLWLFVPSPFPASFNQFMTFADTGGTGIAVGVRSTGQLASNDFTDGTFLPSATNMPLDRWFCIVLEIPSNQTGMTRVYLDDVELTDIAQPNPTPQTPPDHIYVGLDWPNNTIDLSPTTVWLDELIVDTSPITCAQ